ncbi:MAG: glycosyltransferase family 4 protein [Breznakibacter sp.]|nr:glycosyltransferase family 4 protein [Breznakibacter sp.]
MNILIINSIGKKKWGGGEKWMVLAAKELHQLGHTVYLGCRKNSLIQEKANTSNLSVINIPIYTDFSIRGIAGLGKAVEKFKIDVIIACQNRDVRVAGFYRLLSRKDKPLLIARQGIERIHNTWKYRFTFTRLCDAIITNTASLKEKYDSYGWWDSNYVKVIHNGTEILSVACQPLELRSWFNFQKTDNPIIVTTTCRLAKQKNIDLLIDAAAEVIAQNNNYYFVVAGEGSERNQLQKKIDSHGIGLHFKLVGFISDINPLLESSDIFVLPSAYEGMSNSIIEAMMAKLPVICSAVNGAKELIETRKNGLLFAHNDKKELTSHLIYLGNQALRKELGENAYQTITKKFTSTIMAKNYEQHINYLLSKKMINQSRCS